MSLAAERTAVLEEELLEGSSPASVAWVAGGRSVRDAAVSGIKRSASRAEKGRMDELESDLRELDHRTCVEFAIACAERAAPAALYPEDVEEMLELVRAFLNGEETLSACAVGAADLRRIVAEAPVGQRPPLCSAYHAASAATDPLFDVEEAMKAADHACEAAADWKAERAWQVDWARSTLSLKRGKHSPAPRGRMSELASRSVARAVFWR